MISKKVKSLLAVGTLCCAMLVPQVASARYIGEFQNFTIYYSGSEGTTGTLRKVVTNGDAVLNLQNDTGDAWVKANLRLNSNNSYDGTSVGSVCVQRGQRAEFSTSGISGHKYYMGMKKLYNTGGGSVSITGSWSPDTAV